MLCNIGEQVGAYMLNHKRRCFVSFYYKNGNELYYELIHLLKISINSFSNYDIIIYNENDFDEYDIEDRKNLSPEYLYRWKLFSIKKCLETHDEVVWLDSDIIVNHKIDEIWKYFNHVYDFPLLPNNRFSNYINPPTQSGVSDLRDSMQLKSIIHEFDCETLVGAWKQACTILATKECIAVLDEIIFYTNMGIEDEHLFNLFYNKYNQSFSLDGLFICSYFFGTYILNDNMVRWGSDRYNEFMNNYSIHIYNINGSLMSVSKPMTLKFNNFENILFWHGTKDLQVANRVLIDVLKNKYELR